MSNLVSFDWAVKKLLRNKANFDVLEGFLSELLGFDVSIEQILESEGNKQHKHDKFNCVDILVRSKDDELMLVEGVADIFPKYYILKVNNFNNIANDTLDEWIYFLKNSEVPANCRAKGLKEAGEKLRIDKLSEADRRDYQRFKESRWIEKGVTETARLDEKIKIAKNMLLAGLSDEIISKSTEMSNEQIENLRKELKEA